MRFIANSLGPEPVALHLETPSKAQGYRSPTIIEILAICATDGHNYLENRQVDRGRVVALEREW